MTEQEKINFETQKQLAMQDAKFAIFMEELRQQREDIRRAQDRQDAAQAKHDADMKEMNQRFYEKFDAMDAKIDANAKEFTQQLHSNFVQMMIGVGAIMAAIGGLIVATLK